MDQDRRTLELVAQDVIADWGDLHNDVRTLRYQAEQLVHAAVRLESLIDIKHTQLLKTLGDQLEQDLTLPFE